MENLIFEYDTQGDIITTYSCQHKDDIIYFFDDYLETDNNYYEYEDMMYHHDVIYGNV